MATKPGPELMEALGRKAKGAPDASPATPAKSDAAPGPNPDLRPAMKELMQALQSGDLDSATEAFESACRICSSSY